MPSEATTFCGRPDGRFIRCYNEDKRQQVLALGRLGWSLRRIEQATGVRRETASGYLRAAGLTVRGRGRPPARPAKPAISPEASTDPSPASATGTGTDDAAPASGDRSSRAPRASACEPYRELVVDALGRGRNAMAIWQDLVDDHGFPAGYASVRRFVSTVRQQPAVEARVVITSAPAEEAQVDYGEGPMVRDADSGKYRRTRLFVLTLGYSRKAVRLLVHRSSAQVWAELHERAFRRLGGTTRVVVLDNLKEGVLTPDIYDPTLNPLYRDVLAHYGVVALPCRVRDPDRKGKVEAAVGHAQKTPLRGLRFERLDVAQAYLDRWERRWADTRIHGTTKRQVAAMFAEERPALGPLPLEQPLPAFRAAGDVPGDDLHGARTGRGRTAPGLRAHRVDDPTTAGTFHPLLVATVPPGAALTVGSVNRSRSGAASGGLDRGATIWTKAHDAFPPMWYAAWGTPLVTLRNTM